MKIRLDVDRTRMTATLDDNAIARDAPPPALWPEGARVRLGDDQHG